VRRPRGSQSINSQPVTRIPPGHRWARGVNMVELLIVISILSILMLIGVPSYRYVTNSNRVATEVNGLLGAMQFARSEAIKRGLSVTICATGGAVTTATAACGDTTQWHAGWVVFVDVNNNGNMDAGDSVLRIQTPFTTATDSFVADNDIERVTFNREGFATGLPADGGVATITLHTVPLNSAWTRCLQINTVGNMTSEKYNEGSCQ
jgi:type IV fimbrial biogenesis protein FimT